METKLGGRRVRYSKQEWQGFVSEFLASDQDCRSFCQDKGLNPSRFMRWQGVFRNEVSAHEGQPAGFMELGAPKFPAFPLQAGALEIKLDLGGGVVLTLTRS